MSILSILGNIGKGLLGPAAQIGAQIGTSLLGSKLTQAKPNPMEQQVLNQNMEAQRLGMDTGRNLIGMGTQTLQPSMNYWSSILSGNRGRAFSAMAPEANRISEGYQAANQASSALMPRGGLRADLQANLPFQQQHDIASLLQGARPQAATQLGTMGTSILGQGANALYASTAAGRDILNQQAAMRAIEAERGQKMGASLFDTFTKYGMPEVDKILAKLKQPKPAGGTNKVENVPGSIFTGDVLSGRV